MKPTPKGWPRASASVFYDRPLEAIDRLQAAFGFEPRILVKGPQGELLHSELCYDDAVIMVGAVRSTPGEPGWTASPASVGQRNTQALFLYVDDVDAHHARALAAGMVEVMPLTDTDYGPEYWADRGYACVDAEGHRWYFAQRLRG